MGKGWTRIDDTNIRVKTGVALKRAKAGDPMMQALVGQMHLAGVGLRQNRNRGIEWLRKSARSGCSDGMYCLAQALTVESDLDPDGTESEYWLKMAAERGHSKAEVEYGLALYSKGADFGEVESWLTRGYEHGEIGGKRHLGTLLARNNAPESDEHKRGMRLLTEASDAGCSEATMALCGIYQGDGDRFMMTRMLRRASDQRDPDAMFLLGVMTLEGTPYIERNERNAAELLMTSWELGCKRSKWVLGSLHLFGIGVPFDPFLAREYLTDGAENDDPNSIANLGIVYYHGIGVDRDPKRAFKLFERATKFGSREALGNMGVMYATGDGVPCDREKAHEIFVKLKELGDPHADQNLKALESGTMQVRMTLNTGGEYRKLRIIRCDDGN